MWKWFRSVAFLVAFAAAGAPAYAQNALITGALTDQSGAVLPGVTVTARNQETGLTRTAVSGAAGDYRLPELPPGTYTLKVELSGFTTEERSGIILVIDQTAQIDFTLKPAAVAETVTVQGESPIVDVTASNVATSVSNAQIQDLPVASRRWIDLAMLTPGTSQDNIRGFFYRGNVNVGAGTREYSNGFVVDGVNNTWAEMGEPRQNFAMDSIREFKVSTSNYKAEYGLATGGLVTVVSKSGTNDLHGSGLLFFRDKSLTSRTHFESEKPDFERYQYGGIVRDGKAVPLAERTGSYVARVAEEIRRRERRPDMPYYLIGHSGGGQFLLRSTLFAPAGAKGIVASNAGTVTWPLALRVRNSNDWMTTGPPASTSTAYCG